MLIEVVALEPPHYDEGVVTIQLEKLLTGEASEVNSVHAVFGGGFCQEKTCYCAECDKLFHDVVKPLAVGPSQGSSPSILTEPHDECVVSR